MSKAMTLVGVVVLGIITFAVINLIQNVQNGNELDYYLLEETTEAAMMDAVDVGYYKLSGGVVRMSREKFVESFLRRFAQNVDGSRSYDIKIYDVYETPPKASIQVDSSTSVTFNAETAGISNKIDAIIETKYYEDRLLQDIDY